MCLNFIKNYFSDLDKKEKIQTREMEKAIERSKDISEAYLQGGKAIGEILRDKSSDKKK